MLFNDCADTLNGIRQSNQSQTECPDTKTVEVFQTGNKIAYEYFCRDNKRARTVLIERVSDIPNVGFGQGELAIEGSPSFQSSEACAFTNILANAKAVGDNNDEAQLGFIQLVLPTNDFMAILNLSAATTGSVPDSVNIGDAAVDAEFFAIGFDGADATSGNISITALSARRLELPFYCQRYLF